MKLQSLNQLIDYNQVSGVRQAGQAAPMQPLSRAEESMIKEQFPKVSGRPFETYLKTGMRQVEHQGGKGTRIDFRI